MWIVHEGVEIENVEGAVMLWFCVSSSGRVFNASLRRWGLSGMLYFYLPKCSEVFLRWYVGVASVLVVVLRVVGRIRPRGWLIQPLEGWWGPPF